MIALVHHIRLVSAGALYLAALRLALAGGVDRDRLAAGVVQVVTDAGRILERNGADHAV